MLMSSWLAKSQSWAPSDCACCSVGAAKDEHLSSFEKRKKEAASQALVVRATWGLLHIAVIACLFVTESELSHSWRRRHLAYILPYLALAVFNLAFYVKLCVSNPGYLQQGVHALSLATIKRDSEGTLVAEEAAELGIGGLAHVDVPLLGRRSNPQGQRVHAIGVRNSHLDRTTTLPDLSSSSPFSKHALLEALVADSGWDEDRPPSSQRGMLDSPSASAAVRESAGAALNEARTDSAAGILTMADASTLPCNHDRTTHAATSATQVTKHRARGHSIGSDAEFAFAFRQHSSGEWRDRQADEGEPLLVGDGQRGDGSGPSRAGGLPAGEESSLFRKPSKPLSPTAHRPNRRAMQWWEGPNPGRWCEYCGAWQLLRSRHCHDCGRCVRRFDHHCAWVGRCIGQDNHLTFWWYLLVQLLLLSWTSRVVVLAFRSPGPPHASRLLALLLCALPTLPLTGFVAMLLGYHTYLVVTAQTTYEVVVGSEGNGAQVPYLRHLARGTRPFSHGPAQNVLHFCCDRACVSYQMPAGLSLRSDQFL